MKNTFFFFVVLILLTGVARAAELPENKSENIERPRIFNVAINPLGGPGFGLYDGHLEFGILENATIGPRVGIISYSGDGSELGGYLLAARMNFYLNGKRLTDGWTVSPYLGFASVTYKVTNVSGNGGEMSYSGPVLGALVGYQWFFKPGITLGLGIGPSYYSLSGASRDPFGKEASLTAFSGFRFAGEATIGYAL